MAPNAMTMRRPRATTVFGCRTPISAIQAQKRFSAFMAQSWLLRLADNRLVLRLINVRVRSGTSEMPTMKAITVDIAPAKPKVRIKAESEKNNAMNDAWAGAVASTQAGPTTSTA